MKNSTRNFFTLGILLSFCHLILTVVSLVVSFALVLRDSINRICQ